MAFPADMSDRAAQVDVTLADTHEPDFSEIGGMKYTFRLGDLVISSGVPSGAYAGTNVFGDAAWDGPAGAAKGLASLAAHYSEGRLSSVTCKLAKNINASSIPDDPAGSGLALIVVYDVAAPAFDPEGSKQYALKIPFFNGDTAQAKLDYENAATRALIRPVAGVTAVTLIDAKPGNNFKR